jgi:myo-inositol-1(or 4)-monophosphatase
MMNHKDICAEIEKAAKEAGAFIKREAEVFDINRAEKKGLNDFVSYVDKGAEKLLVERLTGILPEAGFITEEGTSTKTGVRYCWVIDPLDGTTNFLHGFYPYAVSIGLMDGEDVVAGVVHEVGSNETFAAWKGGGAWLNGKQVHVSGVRTLADSLIATGLPYSDFHRLDDYMESLTYLCRHSLGIRRLGSAATDLAYVACGRFEGFYEYGLHPWDIAAGMLLVREAGGQVSDFSGNERNLNGDEIVSASSLVFSEFLENVSKFMIK